MPKKNQDEDIDNKIPGNRSVQPNQSKDYNTNITAPSLPLSTNNCWNTTLELVKENSHQKLFSQENKFKVNK
jgi:hypothetical protein